MLVLDERSAQIAVQAFDKAWTKISVECAAELNDPVRIRELLATRILVLTQTGENDAAQLAREAIHYFRARKSGLPKTWGAAEPQRTEAHEYSNSGLDGSPSPQHMIPIMRGSDRV